MPPGRVDLTLYQGDDFAVWLKFTDLEHLPIDLEGITFTGQVRKKTADADAGAEPLADFVCTVIDSPGGIVAVQLTNADTLLIGTALGATVGRWDLQGEEAGRITTYVSGNVNVTAEVTRP